MAGNSRDHGGGLDAAVARYDGTRADWLDLSTGINPTPYVWPPIPAEAWTALPDKAADAGLRAAARQFWNVPNSAEILAVPGASCAIAALPRLFPAAEVSIPEPTYNEHRAGFEAAGWTVTADAPCRVLVNPNNPDGRWWTADDIGHGPLTVIDESFCDIAPDRSLIAQAGKPGVVVLKSFGKFWGLAGLRLGFVIADAVTIAALKAHLGPWPVSGPALGIGRAALLDQAWAAEARLRLQSDADRLDARMTAKGAALVGGCSLFRLYEVEGAAAWQNRLAQGHVWSRVFPYSDRWLRLGLPGAQGWTQLEAAL